MYILPKLFAFSFRLARLALRLWNVLRLTRLLSLLILLLYIILYRHLAYEVHVQWCFLKSVCQLMGAFTLNWIEAKMKPTYYINNINYFILQTILTIPPWPATETCLWPTLEALKAMEKHLLLPSNPEQEHVSSILLWVNSHTVVLALYITNIYRPVALRTISSTQI